MMAVSQRYQTRSSRLGQAAILPLEKLREVLAVLPKNDGYQVRTTAVVVGSFMHITLKYPVYFTDTIYVRVWNRNALMGGVLVRISFALLCLAV